MIISGMVYNGKKASKIFTAVNFTEKEIKAGKLIEVIENMHPVLKTRYELHLIQALNALQELIEKTGIAASHGEIRALNDLLYHLERSGMKNYR